MLGETDATATIQELPFAAFGGCVLVPPGDDAVVAGDGARTYAELDRIVSALAARLREVAADGDPVAVLAPRTPGGVAGVLAASRAGLAFLAVDGMLPKARQDELIADSGASVALVPAGAGCSLPPGVAVIEVPDAPPTASWPGGQAVHGGQAAEPSDADPAYIVYTSGTTGSPKGVVVGHGGLRHLRREQIRVLGLGRGARIYQMAAAGFDAYVFELLMAFGSGAAIVLPGRHGALAGPELTERLRDTRATHLVATPTALAAMDPENLPALRVVCSVGEPCRAGVRDHWLPGRRLLNLYGPAEATIWATYRELDTGTDPGSIGRPLREVRALVLDDRLRPVPDGTPGQLFLAGPTVALGYHGQPELTRERFLPLPGSARAERMYATGDVVERGPDGMLRFVGRADDQVKINGARVEPAEVEAVLRDLPGVDGAAVTAVRSGDGRTVLVAAYTGGQRAPDPAAVFAALRDRLPRWMVPASVRRLQELPVTANGKLDLAAVGLLADPAATPSRDDTGRAAEVATPLEESLLAEARILLDLPDLTLDDNFFDVGGHSIVAFQLLVRADEILGAELELPDLFEARDLADWARRVEGRLAHPGGAHRPPVRPVPPGHDSPSLGQTEILAAERHAAGTAAYTSSWCEHVTDELDADRFVAALRETAQHHDTLRTRYQVGASGTSVILDPVAVVRDERRSLDVADLDEAVRIVERACAEPYQLDREQPVRSHILRLPDGDHVITVMVHHVACDAMSFQVLLAETWRRYQGLTVDPRSAPYRDFAAWQAEFVGGAAGDEQRQWWRERLRGLSALRVRADASRSGARPRQGRRMPLRIEDGLSRAVDELCRSLRVTPFAVLSAAYAVALDPYATATDHVIGTPCTARGMPAFDRTVGYFINTLPLRLRVPENGTTQAWLRAWAAETIRTFAHRDLPLSEITRGWVTADHRRPRVSVLFAVNQTAPESPAGHRRLRLDPGPVKFDVLLTLDRRRARWVGELVHDIAALDQEDARDLAGRFTEALELIASGPGRPVRDLVDRGGTTTTAAEFDFGLPQA